MKQGFKIMYLEKLWQKNNRRETRKKPILANLIIFEKSLNSAIFLHERHFTFLQL